MSKIWKPQPSEVLKNWIKTILDEAEEKLTDWERNFITDIEYKVNRGFSLSERQEEILERIYAEKTS